MAEPKENEAPPPDTSKPAAAKVEKGTLFTIRHPNDDKKTMNVDPKTAAFYIDQKNWKKIGTVKPKAGPGVVVDDKK